MEEDTDIRLNALEEARLLHFALTNKIVDPNSILTVEDTARILGMKTSTVRVWIRKGQLRAARLSVNKHLRIIGKDLLDFVASKRKELTNESE